MSAHVLMTFAMPDPSDLDSAPLELGEGLACPGCGGFLDLLQPDQNLPDRLLGTCSDCSAWTVVDVGPRGRISLTSFP